MKTLAIALALNGPWQALPAQDQPAALYMPGASGPWCTLTLPGRWFSRGLDVQGVVWFKRRFALRSAHGRAWLDVGGADYSTDAWIDGRWVGHHIGGSAPFRLALGGLGAGTHEVSLRVDSPYEPIGSVWSLHKHDVRGILNHHDTRPGGAWSLQGQDHNAGGVWGDVAVQLTGAAAIARLGVRPHQSSVGLAVSIDHAGTPAEGRLEATLTPVGGGAAQRWTRAIRLSGRTAIDWTLPVAHPQRWTTWDRGTPHRYRLDLQLIANGQVSDARTRTVGLRDVVRLKDGTFALNGQRIFLRGTNYISSPWPDDTQGEKLRHDVQLMREANVNAVRVHGHTEPEAFYDACDAAGILVWQDLPLQWGYADTPEVHASARGIAEDIVAGYGHHPSIFAWCAHNEAPYSAEWMKYKYPDYDPNQNLKLDTELVETLHRADPSRYAHSNSDTAEHPWLGWYSGSWLDYGKPTNQSLITEYGAQALPDRATLQTIFPAWALWPTDDKAWALWEYHGFQRHETFQLAGVQQGPDLESWIANTQIYQGRLTAYAAERYRLQKYQPVGAAFQFMFNDTWPSVSWGALDYLRKPKAGYEAMRRAYQPVLPVVDAPMIQPAGQRLSFPIRVINDRPTGQQAYVHWYETVDFGRGGGPQRVVTNARVWLPQDGISAPVVRTVDLPARGLQVLDVWVTDTRGRELGRNTFEYTVQ